MDSEKKTTLIQGVKYLIIGSSSALIELILFMLLSAALGVNVVVSNVIAVVCSTIFNFLMNRGVTFKSASSPLRSLVLYLVLFAFNTTFSSTFIWWLTSVGMYPLLAKIISMACIVSWNFVLYKKVVFK